MAFTTQQKQALATWLEANIHKAVHDRTHREGIKQTIQVVDPIDGSTQDKEVPILDPETGNRTFTEVTLPILDFDEVILRVQAKAQKQGFNPSLDAIEALLLEHKDNLLLWVAPATISSNHSALDPADVLAEDPDA